MGYPGGKSGAGVWQSLINHMPPHHTYIEPFAGGAAVFLRKRPAQLNLALDRDEAAIERLTHAVEREYAGKLYTLTSLTGELGGPRVSADSARLVASYASSDGQARFRFYTGDALEFLLGYPYTGGELVYCDPPYLAAVRSRRRLYTHEMSDADHLKLLALLAHLPARVMISGYWHPLYVEALASWERFQFQATNRAGQRTEEWVWSNFPAPLELHDYGQLGSNYRERERIRRKVRRWTRKLERMPRLEAQGMLAAIQAWRGSGHVK